VEKGSFVFLRCTAACWENAEEVSGLCHHERVCYYRHTLLRLTPGPSARQRLHNTTPPRFCKQKLPACRNTATKTHEEARSFCLRGALSGLRYVLVFRLRLHASDHVNALGINKGTSVFSWQQKRPDGIPPNREDPLSFLLKAATLLHSELRSSELIGPVGTLGAGSTSVYADCPGTEAELVESREPQTGIQMLNDTLNIRETNRCGGGLRVSHPSRRLETVQRFCNSWKSSEHECETKLNSKTVESNRCGASAAGVTENTLNLFKGLTKLQQQAKSLK